MLDLSVHQVKKEPLSTITGYAPPISLPASMLYGMPKPVSDIAMEDYTSKSSGLGEEIRRRQENLRFVLKQFKKDFVRSVTFDFLLNSRLAKAPYTSLMNIEILNPMGLRSPLLDYALVILDAISTSQLVVAKTLPNAKIFFASLIADNELENSRPIDSMRLSSMNGEAILDLKTKLSRMLDSKYENASTTFGEQFKRVKDWDDCCKIVGDVADGLADLSKYNLTGDIKEITGLLDKLALHLKRNDDKVSATNCTTVKVATLAIAEEISFLGATIHLADTLVSVMEDNKEYLREYLTK